jgi:hypothetical protein
VNLYTVDTNESLPTCQLLDPTVPDPNSINARSDDSSSTQRAFLTRRHDEFRAVYTLVFLLTVQDSRWHIARCLYISDCP